MAPSRLTKTPQRHLRAMLWLPLMALLMCACRHTSAKVDLRIEGVSEGFPVKMVYYGTDARRGMMVELVTLVTDGKGSVKLPSLTPSMVWVYGTGNTPRLAFYAEPGDKITITGRGTDPAKWHIEGGDLNDRWEEWRTAHAKTLDRGSDREVNKAVAAYVKEHTSDPFSTLLLLTTYRRNADEEGYRRLWKSLKPKALRQQLIDAIGRADQPDGNMLPAAECPELVLNVHGDSIAHLRSKERDETLLYFWVNTTANRRSTLDSLQRLAGRATRRVVDVCLENDSNTWIAVLHRDSAANLVHAWAYGGPVNKAIAPLEVPSTPYFILLDRKGRQTYRGTSLPPKLRKEAQ